MTIDYVISIRVMLEEVVVLECEENEKVCDLILSQLTNQVQQISVNITITTMYSCKDRSLKSYEIEY